MNRIFAGQRVLQVTICTALDRDSELKEMREVRGAEVMHDLYSRSADRTVIL